MKTIKKPEQIFLIAAVLLLGASIVHYKETGAFSLGGRNFILPIRNFCWAWAAILGTLWAVYLGAKSALSSNNFTWMHVLLTMAALVITFSVVSANDFIAKPDDVQVIVASALFLAGQVCLGWNIFKGRKVRDG